MEVIEPTIKTFYIKVGNSRSIDLPSNVVKGEVVVCGKENIMNKYKDNDFLLTYHFKDNDNGSIQSNSIAYHEYK